MRAVDYALRQAWASLWRSKASSGLAIVAIALAMTVLGALLLMTWNAERVLVQWTSAAEFSVYLDPAATADHRASLEGAIDESGLADGRRYISTDQALARFRREFTSLAAIADGLDENPFPASIEVRVRAEAERDGRAAGLVGRLAAMPGVADVRHDQEWLTRAGSGLETIRAAGLMLAALMAAAAAVTVATVVRLGLHARRDEIEIMDLVGSPMAFIRGPFVAEGLLQGGAWGAHGPRPALAGSYRGQGGLGSRDPGSPERGSPRVSAGPAVGGAGGRRDGRWQPWRFCRRPPCGITRCDPALTDVQRRGYTEFDHVMSVSRNRLSRFLIDSRPACEPVLHSLTSFYREEFVRCQRCLDEQREYYSEGAISDVEQALTSVMAQLDRLCTAGDADQVVGKLLQQFDVVTGLSAWTDPRQVH